MFIIPLDSLFLKTVQMYQMFIQRKLRRWCAVTIWLIVIWNFIIIFWCLFLGDCWCCCGWIISSLSRLINSVNVMSSSDCISSVTSASKSGSGTSVMGLLNTCWKPALLKQHWMLSGSTPVHARWSHSMASWIWMSLAAFHAGVPFLTSWRTSHSIHFL